MIVGGITGESQELITTNALHVSRVDFENNEDLVAKGFSLGVPGRPLDKVDPPPISGVTRGGDTAPSAFNPIAEWLKLL